MFWNRPPLHDGTYYPVFIIPNLLKIRFSVRICGHVLSVSRDENNLFTERAVNIFKALAPIRCMALQLSLV